MPLGPATRAAPPIRNMQQATVNLFADMGAQPATLIAGLTPATHVDRHDRADLDDHVAAQRRHRLGRHGRHDHRAPRPTPAAAWSPASRSPPTAARTWHPATTMSAADTSVTWSYSWIAHGNPTHDDQGPRRRRQRQPGDTRGRETRST